MEILELKSQGGFRYLWAKRVTAVNLMEHCARCLEGEYLKGLNGKVNELRNVPLEGGIWYFCGVTQPYVWEHNFHAAFRECPGSVAEVERHGVRLTIKDAEEIPITAGYVAGHRKSALKSYNTCRCWMFATEMADTGILPHAQRGTR